MSLLIRRRRKIDGLEMSTQAIKPVPISRTTSSSHASLINRVINKFSAGNQGTLYRVKLFGIMTLVRALLQLSTVACPLYDECGDLTAQSFRRIVGAKPNDGCSGGMKHHHRV